MDNLLEIMSEIDDMLEGCEKFETRCSLKYLKGYIQSMIDEYMKGTAKGQGEIC